MCLCPPVAFLDSGKERERGTRGPGITGRGRIGNREIPTYTMKLSAIQQMPNIHPTVVSPLRLFHPSTISVVKGRPATSAAKRISAVPHT